MSLCQKQLYGLKVVLTLFLILLIQDTFGQKTILDQRYSFECQQCSFVETLDTLEKKLENYYFSFDPCLYKERNNITFSCTNLKLRQILDSLVMDTTIRYSMIDRQIVLYRQNLRKDSSQLLKKNNPGILEISAKVIDKQTGKPVPFANIGVLGKSIGTVSNIHGEFVLKVPSHMSADSLGISFIGYKTYMESLRQAAKHDIFELQQDYIPIQEVIIRKTEPLLLLNSALKKIPENYPVNPSLLTSFYRETIKKGNEFSSITEAVLQTYKAGYTKEFSGDEIKIIKGRKSENISRNDTILMKLKAGLNTTLLLDIIKNPADFLQKENFQFYEYHLVDIIVNNDQETYVIEFKQKENVREPLYYGKIYINIRDLAITHLDFSMNQDGIGKTGGRFVVKKPRWLKVKPVLANYSVSYRKYGNKYYLNLVRCETEFRLRKRKQWFGSSFNSKIEMAVTSIDTTNIKKFRYREISDTRGILTEIVYKNSEIFWENYNYIKPDEPLEEAIKKISKGIYE